MAKPKVVTKILDAMTERGRATFPEDDPLHHLHVTPLARESTDPPAVQSPFRTHQEVFDNPGEVVTEDLSVIVED